MFKVCWLCAQLTASAVQLIAHLDRPELSDVLFEQDVAGRLLETSHAELQVFAGVLSFQVKAVTYRGRK